MEVERKQGLTSHQTHYRSNDPTNSVKAMSLYTTTPIHLHLAIVQHGNKYCQSIEILF